MKLDIGPVRSTYVAPAFGSDENLPLDPALRRRMHRPMLVGAAVISVLVVGLIAWASMMKMSTGITVPGEVRVESNRKTIRHREAGTIRKIMVTEGQHVAANQPLLTFDDVEPRAAYDVFRNQADVLLAQSARYTAEATNRPAMSTPPEFAARLGDARIAGLMRDQQFEFTTRLQLFESQTAVLNQRLDQIQTQIQGQQGQVDSVEEQRRLTADEMSGYQTLYEKGFAPRQLILRYQRQIADLAGRKGSLLADIGRLRQQMGETRMQMAALRDQRQSQAAEGVQETQSKLADILPRLTAATQALNSTTVRSPVDGYVFDLTQFTVGGVAGAGEVLMNIVPANAPMIISAMVKPDDIDDVRVGMAAKVKITAFNPRWHNPMDAKVMVVSADRITNEKSGASFYRVDIRIDPKELTKLERTAQITPGMPAQAMIVTGKTTLMGTLISPITDTLHQALREK